MKALETDIKLENTQSVGGDWLSIVSYYEQEGHPDSSLHYAEKAYYLGLKENHLRMIRAAGEMLTRLFKNTKQIDSAFKYQSIMIAVKDSLVNARKVTEFQNIAFNERLHQQDIEAAKAQYKTQIRLNVLLALLGIFLLATTTLYRNNKQKQKANKLLQAQKQEIDFQKTKAEKAYQELKSTQAQLMQSEKMASLGELTAGIAHEIQNPLNFVNNFSDVNTELLTDLIEVADQGNIDEVKSIANDVINNEQKINLHGRRADAIVKGMLQHSRASTGKKELTDINALAGEYVRLAYHGLRAKDKDFNVSIETHFDESIGKIEVVPQDIGRVLLNLYNNAFYAVSARQKEEGESFKPIIKIQTKKVDSKVEIVVKDNGNGIPQNVINKIFQPFFTTKPTGQGTGLGLSLSYDIIKAHGGEIKVESKEGEGAEFIIILPD